MKKIVYFLLLILWLSIIFVLSNQNGELSGSNSGSIIKDILELIYNILKLPKDNIDNILNIIHEPIRECAHAFEYFVLGFLTYKNLENFKIKENKYVITILFCFVCAVTDEIHQMFIPGRTFQYFDILMDMLGIFSIISIIYIINYKKNKVHL